MLAAALASCKVGAPLTVGPNKTLACGDTTPSCVATSETRTIAQDCSSVVAQILQKRDYTCVQNVGTWGDWYNITSCPFVPPMTYQWTASSWGACSAPSGGGTQTRTVNCLDSNGNLVGNSYCSGSMPASTQNCNTQTNLALNCTNSSTAANLYKTIGGRCGEDDGISYWTAQIPTLGTSGAKTAFTEAYKQNCWSAYLTSSFAECNSHLLCNPGWTYISNTNYCKQ